jgi:ParB-like chromosome segregation protein Spo0J
MRPTSEPEQTFCHATSILPVAVIKTGQRQVAGRTSDIASGIIKHGLVKPIAVVVDGPKYQVVHGEERFAAAKRLGWTEIPAQVVRPDNEQE